MGRDGVCLNKKATKALPKWTPLATSRLLSLEAELSNVTLVLLFVTHVLTADLADEEK